MPDHSRTTQFGNGFQKCSIIKRRYYWFNYDYDVRDFINNCQICRKHKYNRKKHFSEFTFWKPLHKNHIVVLDFTGPFQNADRNGNKYVLSVIEC